mmetsp:Transcript_47554/g.83640  ORF Transcript_47554/g.83640 Transcript_47554/m.83640 type:complete len:420 (-) Transcript_47554:96-1355(-)
MVKFQKKQRKGRTWRKAKIEDVEEAMEDDRLVQKLKRKVGQTDDQVDELFTIDTKGSCEGLSNSSRRAIARAKIFPPKGPNIGLSASEEAKIERAERQLEASRQPAPKKGPEVFDLWSSPAAASSSSDREASRLRPAQKPAVKVPRTLHQKVGLAPAVLPAHEGQSMNPQQNAYEDLACMAAAVELEKEREAEDQDRKMKPITHELRDLVGAEKLKGMEEAEKMQLYRSLVLKSAADADGSAAADKASPTKGQRKQKSQAQRNKEKKRRGVDAKEDQLRQQKRLEKSVGQVGSLLKDMKDRSEWEEKRREYRESMRTKSRELEATAGVLPKKRRLGGAKFEEEAAVIPDAAAAAKGLRAMPLQGGAVKERLASVMRRGLLPAHPENSKDQANRVKKRVSRAKQKKKVISPLLKDNLLLR